MSLPLVELKGDVREQGAAHGRALANEKRSNLQDDRKAQEVLFRR